MIRTVYLAGSINGNVETYKWRERVNEYFKDHPFVNTLDPCKSRFNQILLDIINKTNCDTTVEFTKQALKQNPILLVPKDRQQVKKADVVMVNLNSYSSKRPALGTFFELAWAYDASEKMVIGIFSGDAEKDFPCNHPFVRATIHSWVKNEIEACKLLEDFIEIRGEE